MLLTVVEYPIHTRNIKNIKSHTFGILGKANKFRAHLRIVQG